MLTLSFKEGRSAYIYDDNGLAVKVTHGGADRFGGIRLNFGAPQSVKIDREGLLREKSPGLIDELDDIIYDGQ